MQLVANNRTAFIFGCYSTPLLNKPQDHSKLC